MASTSLPPPLPALDNTFGSMLTGVLISSALWGICSIQMYYYFTHYAYDIWAIKLMVGAVGIFETVHQALVTYTIYYYVISNYANPLHLDTLIWSLSLNVLFSGLTAFLVQSFFTFRVFRLSQESYRWTTPLGVIVLAGLAVSMVYAGIALRFKVISAAQPHLEAVSLSVNILGVVADIYIAGALCWLLQGSRTGFDRSDSMINRLMMYTVNTGLLTASCAVASLVLTVVLPKTLLYVPFYFALGRLYANSMLATLNARKSFKASLSGEEGGLELTSKAKAALSRGTSTQRKFPSAREVVSIHIETQVDRDASRDFNQDWALSSSTPTSASPFVHHDLTFISELGSDDDSEVIKDKAELASPV